MNADAFFLLKRDRLLRACGDAPPALHAVDVAVEQLGHSTLRLGIRAPRAGERTALKKYGASDTGAVVYRVALDIEYQSFHIVHAVFSFRAAA